MPSDLAFKAMNAIHRSLLAITGGRAGWTALDMPVLELTTTGRQTGRSRTVMLTSPVQEGTTLVVVASRGGDDKAPAWFLNLQDNPEVGVALQGRADASRCTREWPTPPNGPDCGPWWSPTIRTTPTTRPRPPARSHSSCSNPAPAVDHVW